MVERAFQIVIPFLFGSLVEFAYLCTIVAGGFTCVRHGSVEFDTTF